ncbi:hypothetical protein [Streptomyces sp. NPDC002250]|uniref:hypothetical protein n=1 Tax=Streptomyces sp. NPDC002250 TaxID=3364641 RepID=UPI0036AAF94D
MAGRWLASKSTIAAWSPVHARGSSEGNGPNVDASCSDDERGENSLQVLDATARTLRQQSLDSGAPVLIGSAAALTTAHPHLAPLAQADPAGVGGTAGHGLARRRQFVPRHADALP